MLCYELLKPLIVKFNGDAENFFPLFYNIFKKTPGPFLNLSYHCTLLLGMELCNHVLIHISGTSTTSTDNSSFNHSLRKFDAKQTEIITYLSGYVVGTFYRRIRFGKTSSHDSFYASQCLDFLSSCKLQEQLVTDMSNMSLVNLKNCGGLWKINADTLAIFSLAESHFLQSIEVFTTKIDALKIVDKLMEDVNVLVTVNKIRRVGDTPVKKEVAMNLCRDLLILYIRVRSHSHAKGQKQKHKIAKVSLKARSLRTERKKADGNLHAGY